MDNPFLEIVERLDRIESILEQISELEFMKDLNNNKDQIGDIKLAQEVTGLARSTIYGLVNKRQVPHFKKGGKLFFSSTELIAWIRQGRQLTKSEIFQEVERQQVLSCKKYKI